MQEPYQTLLGLITGLGLAAACGFRVFVPMLVASIAIRAGAVHVAHGFQWIGSDPALLGFSVATVLEIGGYYLPGLDHVLDTLSTPAAVVAGALLSTAFITDIDPWLRWTLAVIVGGGIAGTVQASTVAARVASAVTTVGLGNPVVATAELAGASVVSTTAVVGPLIVVLVLGTVAILSILHWRRRVDRSRAPSLVATPR